MESCIFCKIINGDIASKKVYEDDKAFAFMILILRPLFMCSSYPSSILRA